MNFFKTVALVLIAINLVGCAGRAANPITVRQISDERKSCSTLRMEMSSIENNIQRLIPESNKTGKNVALALTGALICPPL